MKKFFLVLTIMLFVCSTSFAKDISKGTVQISGGSNILLGNMELEVDNTEVADTDVTNFDVSAVYYIADNIGLGLEYYYENEDTSFGGGSFDEFTTVGFGPQITIQLPVNNTTNFYLSGLIGVMNIEGSDEFGTYLDVSTTAVGLGAGVSLFPIDSVSVDLGMNYLTADGDEDTTNVDVEMSEFGLGMSVSVYF